MLLYENPQKETGESGHVIVELKPTVVIAKRYSTTIVKGIGVIVVDKSDVVGETEVVNKVD